MKRILPAILLVGTMLTASFVSAQDTASPAPQNLPAPTIATPSKPLKAADRLVDTLHVFYAARDFKPVWTDDAQLSAKGRALPAILAGAVNHGIDPETYGVAAMRKVLDGAVPADDAGWQKLEALWTYNLLQYASDLAGRPVDADTLKALVSGDTDGNLQALAPEQPLYNALKTRLAVLNAQEAKPDPATIRQPISFGKTYFKPGMVSSGVKALRARMADYGAEAIKLGDNEDVYDESLAKAVATFQGEHGLKSDGSIGPETLKILNRDAASERRQIIANMQRLREPHRRTREDTRIEVSIARFWLTAFDNGREALGMKVIVGQPRRQTISFRTEISGVRLNPTWNVPDTIKREDFLPQLVKDPAKLLRDHNGVKVVHEGKNVDPTGVDWSQMTPKELSQIRFWRPAGDGNPLGRYRVIMENPYDIYLHDTNKPELFEASMRAQSSGCVRVSDPAALTTFILNHKSGWNAQKTADILKAGRTVDVVMEKKMPIYLDYVTAWLDSRDQVVLGSDVYGLDISRYDGLVKHALTTQRNAQKILDRVTDIFNPDLQEAHHRDPVLTQSTN